MSELMVQVPVWDQMPKQGALESEGRQEISVSAQAESKFALPTPFCSFQTLNG